MLRDTSPRTASSAAAVVVETMVDAGTVVAMFIVLDEPADTDDEAGWLEQAVTAETSSSVEPHRANALDLFDVEDVRPTSIRRSSGCRPFDRLSGGEANPC